VKKAPDGEFVSQGLGRSSFHPTDDTVLHRLRLTSQISAVHTPDERSQSISSNTAKLSLGSAMTAALAAALEPLICAVPGRELSRRTIR